MRFTSSIFAALALVSAVSADIFVTEPIGSTVCEAGKPCAVTWKDDGKVPTLPTIGACNVGLFTGSQQVQFELQPIQTGINVDPPQPLTFIPDPAKGETGQFYFVRFTCTGFKNPANPAQDYTGFSARFTINGMTGTFTPEIKNQLSQSASVAPATSAPATSSAVAPKPTTPLTTPATATPTTANRAAATTASAAPTTTANAAVSLSPLGGFAAAAGAIFGLIAMGL